MEHEVIFTMSKSRKECGMVSNFHGDNDEGQFKRWDEAKKEFVPVVTTAVVGYYNKGGFNNVDCSDVVSYTVSKYKRKTSHLWRTALEIPIFKLLPLAAWLLWRVLDPEKKTTHSEFISQIVEKRIEAPFLQYTRKKEEITDLRVRKRFTPLPISQLNTVQIRMEFGPHKKYDVRKTVRGKTRAKRALTCMYYCPEEKGNRVICDFDGCKRKTIFGCDGCGVRGCMKKVKGDTKSHMRSLHARFNKANTRLKRAL